MIPGWACGEGADPLGEAADRRRGGSPWALREGIILHYLQTFNQSFDLPLRPLNGSTYGQDAPGGRHVTLVTTSSGLASQIRFRRRVAMRVGRFADLGRGQSARMVALTWVPLCLV